MAKPPKPPAAKPPGPGDKPPHETEWQHEIRQRLDELQRDVDAMQDTLTVIKGEIAELHAMDQMILVITKETLEIVKQVEEQGNLSRITARFGRVA